MGPTVEASHNAAADLALKALADSGVKIGSPQQRKKKEAESKNASSSSSPRTLVSVNAKKKQKAAAAAAANATVTSSSVGNSTEASTAKSVSNGREVVVDEKVKDDLKS